MSTKVNHCAVIYESDSDFGDIGITEDSINPNSISVTGSELLPSQKLTKVLSHLTDEQQKKMLALLDKYPECFSDKPGLCDIIQHKIKVTEDFKPKRLGLIESLRI